MKHLLLITLALFSITVFAKTKDKPNILFIAIDDMNDWTGFLDGHPQTITPNMDAFAKRGVNFTNAQCPAPGCSPSRNALLYGVEPFESGLYPFYDGADKHDELHERYVSLPRFFKENGYNTYGAGKIHHGSIALSIEWSDYHEPTKSQLVFNTALGYQAGNSRKMSFCPTSNPLPDHPDYKVASYGIDVLKQRHEEPFFLAVGIVKPHLPFVCPQQFFDALPEDVTSPDIKADDHDDIPWVGRAMVKIGDESKFRQADNWNKVRRAYLACISWADYNIGRVLDELEQSPYADNTVIVLWSDHGYHMGEKRTFRKFTLWEEAAHVPFIIYDPRIKADNAENCDQPVSLIDIYRTLAELTGIECKDNVAGQSLVPQLKDPMAIIEKPAITSWGRGNYALRSQDWRYIRYYDGSEELYRHSTDPNHWTNLAKDSEFDAVKSELAAYLPQNEAPLDTAGYAPWSLVGADVPEKVEQAKKNWNRTKNKINPPLAD